MRLLLIDKEFPPNPHGGIGSYNAAMVGALRKMGHQVAVVTASSRQSSRRFEKDGPVYFVTWGDRTSAYARHFGCLEQVLYGKSLVPVLKHAVHEFKPDLIEMVSAGGYAVFSARKFQGHIPIVTRFHGSLGRLPIERTSLERLSSEYKAIGTKKVASGFTCFLAKSYWILERQLLSISDLITFPSEFSRSWLKGILGITGPVIHNGTGMASFDNLAATRRNGVQHKSLCFAARCSVDKGILVLERAADTILRSDPTIVINIVGPVENALINARLAQLAQRHAGRVMLPGRIPHNEVLKTIAESFLLIHPTFYETHSMVSVEALALGTPVIASDTGPMPELIDNMQTGCLFPVGSDGMLSDSVLNTAARPQMWREMSEKAKMKARQSFDIERTAREMVSCYREKFSLS